MTLLEGFEYLLRTHGLDKDCLIGHTHADRRGAGAAPRKSCAGWTNGRASAPMTAWAVLDDGVLELGDQLCGT